MGEAADVMQKIQQLQQQVLFLRDSNITQDLRGHSKLLCLVVQRGDKKFFTKVYMGDNRDHLKKVEEIYQKFGVPTARIVNLQYLPVTDETVCSYEYIEGPTLKELLPTSTLAEYESLGYQAGAFLNRFSATKGNLVQIQANFEDTLKKLWENVFQKKFIYNQTHNPKLPSINLYRLQKSFEQLKTFVYAAQPVFIHNDINLSNIIIHNHKTYFIDTDGCNFNFRSLGFRGNCWWGWTGNNVDKEHAIYRGIYRGLFQDSIPAEFRKELAFAIVYEFILRVYKYRNDMEQVRYSFLRWYDIFTITDYFENYRFDWF